MIAGSGSSDQSPTLLSVQIGRIMPLGPNGVPSAFVKRPIDGPIAIGPLGVAGDEQADLTVHGGLDQAVYAYPMAHYDAWQAAFPEHTGQFRPGGMGENFTISGLDEDSVCIGDIFRVGGTVLQVSDVRQPCYKFALRFDDNRLPKAMVRNGLSGWYYRVLEAGTVSPRDAIDRIDHPNPAWPVRRVFQLLTGKAERKSGLTELARLDATAARLKELAASLDS